MKFLSLLPLICILVFFMSSCRSPRDLEFRELKNISVENVDFRSATLKADLIYYNPNNFGLELNRADLDIYLDSSYFGHSSQDFQIAIPKRDLFTLPVKLELDIKNLLKNGLNAFFNKEVQIRAIGSIRLGKAGVYKSFKMDYSTMQKIPFF